MVFSHLKLMFPIILSHFKYLDMKDNSSWKASMRRQCYGSRREDMGEAGAEAQGLLGQKMLCVSVPVYHLPIPSPILLPSFFFFLVGCCC